MKSLLAIHGPVVESHKFSYEFRKNHVQLREIYTLIAYKNTWNTHRLRNSQLTTNFEQLKPTSRTDVSAETLDRYLRMSTNDERQKHVCITHVLRKFGISYLENSQNVHSGIVSHGLKATTPSNQESTCRKSTAIPLESGLHEVTTLLRQNVIDYYYYYNCGGARQPETRHPLDC